MYRAPRIILTTSCRRDRTPSICWQRRAARLPPMNSNLSLSARRYRRYDDPFAPRLRKPISQAVKMMVRRYTLGGKAIAAADRSANHRLALINSASSWSARSVSVIRISEATAGRCCSGTRAASSSRLITTPTGRPRRRAQGHRRDAASSRTWRGVTTSAHAFHNAAAMRKRARRSMEWSVMASHHSRMTTRPGVNAVRRRPRPGRILPMPRPPP